MPFGLTPQCKPAQMFSLHPVLKNGPVVFFEQPLPRTGLGTKDGRHAPVGQKSCHQPIGHYHQFRHQHAAGTFPVGTTDGQFTVIADPYVHFRKGNLHRSRIQPLLTEFFRDVMQNHNLRVFFSHQIDIIIGPLVGDPDQARHNFEINQFHRGFQANQNADGRPDSSSRQAAQIFGQSGRQHGDLAIRHVDGTPPPQGFLIDAPPFGHKLGDIGNMNAQHKTVRPGLDAQGVVKVKR